MTTPITPVCTIDATGVHAPDFPTIQAYFQSSFANIYGADIYLGNDSQDGELIGLLSQAVADANNMAVAAYLAYSPMTAQGVGLDSAVKINGIVRPSSSASTVDLVIVGTVGLVIRNGVAGDGTNRWDLPVSVTIPVSGTITVLGTCETIGNVTAGPASITQILTPTAGWQSVNNPSAATPGQPVYTDAQLRQLQSVSTALPSRTVLDGITGAILSIPGVSACQPYENDTASIDGNGVPSHSISMIVNGGDPVAIATAIATKKAPGSGTYGTTSESIADSYGVLHTINFFRPTPVLVYAIVYIMPLTGYTTAIGTEIQAAMLAAINATPIGSNVILGRLWLPANLTGPYAAPASPNDALTYEVTSIVIAAAGTTLNGTITSGATSLTVNSDAAFPGSGNYVIAIDGELMNVTGGQGTTTWTVTRGYLGTTAQAHINGAGVGYPVASDVVVPFNGEAELSSFNLIVA